MQYAKCDGMQAIRSFSGLFLLLLASNAFALPPTPATNELKAPLWVDLTDVAKYRPDLMVDAPLLVKSFTTNLSLYSTDGSTIAGGAELQAYPLMDANQKGVTYRHLALLMNSTANNYFFRLFSVHVSYAGTVHSITQIIKENDVLLSNAQFTVNTALVERLVVLNDAKDNLQIVYPLGVGGIDPGVAYPGINSILTPLFSNAMLKRSTVIAALNNPTYFRMQPYMPITNSRGVLTAIAFHITILSDQEWANYGPNYLVRGFESHGCMRLRQKDLAEFHTIVMNGELDALPVNVSLFANEIGNLGGVSPLGGGLLPEVHPYPYSLANYQSVENFAVAGAPPMSERDPVEHLRILQTTPGQPNFATLTGFNAEDEIELNAFLGITEANGRPTTNHPVTLH